MNFEYTADAHPQNVRWCMRMAQKFCGLQRYVSTGEAQEELKDIYDGKAEPMATDQLQRGRSTDSGGNRSRAGEGLTIHTGQSRGTCKPNGGR